MTPFKTAGIDPQEAKDLANTMLEKWRECDPLVCNAITAKAEEGAMAQIAAYINDELLGSRMFVNDTYQVAVRTREKWIHLSIKRLDRECIHDWRELQEIKNQIVGPEYEGIEIYPAESRKVDTSNQFHIWIINDPAYRFPVGFNGRFVSDTPMGKSVNRPLK